MNPESGEITGSCLVRFSCGRTLAREAALAGFTFSDRYSALGLPLPDQATMCHGPCEGTGVVPVKGLSCPLETDPELLKRWQDAEAAQHAPDGWHFVKCPTCEGTGLAPGMERKPQPEATRESLAGQWSAVSYEWSRSESDTEVERAVGLVREMLDMDVPLVVEESGTPGRALLVRALAAMCRRGIVAREGDAALFLSGTKRALVEAESQSDLGDFHVLVDGRHGPAVGFIRYGLGREISYPGEFATLAGEHAVTEAQAQARWPGVRSLWFYPVREFIALESPQPIEFTPDEECAPETGSMRFKEGESLPIREDAGVERLLALHGRLHQSWRESVARSPNRPGPVDIHERHKLLERVLAARGLLHPTDEADGLDWYMSLPAPMSGFGEVYREAVYHMTRALGEARAVIRVNESLVKSRGRVSERLREYVTEAFCPTGKGGGTDNSCGGKSGDAPVQLSPIPGVKDGIPKAEMPRIPHRASAEFDQFLTDLGVNGGYHSVDAKTLKPLQSDYKPSTVDRLKNGSPESEASLAKPIFISRDGYIIDGHHTWIVARDLGRSVNALVVNADKDQAMKLSYGFKVPDQYVTRQTHAFLLPAKTGEAFCPTGKGGGVDNSCGGKGGAAGAGGMGGGAYSGARHPGDGGVGKTGGIHSQPGIATHPGDSPDEKIVHPGNARTGPITAKDYKLSARSITVTKEDDAAAKIVHEKAKTAEPQITRDISSITAESGGEIGRMVVDGQKTSIKGQGSLARKIATAVDENPGTTAQQAALGIKDSVRYTSLFDNDKLVSGAKAVDAKLVASGYERVGDPKNYFALPGSPYRGVNANYRDTKTGTVIEVQYHTKATMDMVEANHVEYNVWRESKDPMQREKMNVVMLDRWRGFSNPPGVETLFGGWTKK